MVLEPALRHLTVVRSTKHWAHEPSTEINFGLPISPPFDQPRRVEVIVEAMERDGYPILEAAEHSDDWLAKTHSPDLLSYLQTIHARWIAAGGPPAVMPDTFLSQRPQFIEQHKSPFAEAKIYCFDTETPIRAGTWMASRAAIDTALTGADLIVEGHRYAYAVCRPPGHHAGPNYYGGYCYLNNAAVAAMCLSSKGKVLILDLDYHHGNGTQDIFTDSPAVTYVSIHCDPAFAYPYFSGWPSDPGREPLPGRTLSVLLSPGTDSRAYMHALTGVLKLAVAQAPDFVVVSIGFDTHQDDPVGKFTLTTDSYRSIGRLLHSVNTPILLVQEGGYDLTSLGQCAVELCGGMLEQA